MIEDISTIVIAASAVVTAGATIILVIITRRYVLLTQDILQATNKPEVILFFHDISSDNSSDNLLDTISETIIVICVQNIGTGFASDIKFTGDLSLKPTLFAKPDGTLAEMEPFKSGIDYLPAGYKIDKPLFLLEEMTELPKQSFNILVSYKDSTDTLYEKNFLFEVGHWGNPKQFVFPKKD